MNKKVSVRRCSKSSKDQIPERVPMTMEHLAFLVAKESRGEEVDHPICREMRDILHDSIHNMVESYVWKYCTSSTVENNDLFQECMKKIFSSIGNYDPKKGKFTTWSSWVCSSVLNREYHKRMRWEKHVVHSERLLENCEDEKRTEASPLFKEMVDTVKTIMRKNQDKMDMIVAIFGNPNDEGYIFPAKLEIASIARETGIPPYKIRSFLEKTVRPYFQNRFVSLCA